MRLVERCEPVLKWVVGDRNTLQSPWVSSRVSVENILDQRTGLQLLLHVQQVIFPWTSSLRQQHDLTTRINLHTSTQLYITAICDIACCVQLRTRVRELGFIDLFVVTLIMNQLSPNFAHKVTVMNGILAANFFAIWSAFPVLLWPPIIRWQTAIVKCCWVL